MRVLILFLCCFTCFGACSDAGTLRRLAGNFETNLLGPVDSAPETWGSAAFVVHPLTFTPPPGCRVEIVRVIGDLIGWPLGTVPAGTQAGILVAIAPTPATATTSLFSQSQSMKSGRVRRRSSVWADFADDGCMLYHQVGTDGPPARLAFDEKIVSGILNTDNVLNFTMSDWLNNTGLTVHMEVTFVIWFRFISG